MHSTLPAVLAIFMLFATTGCASIVSKSSYPVTIKTSPADAKITITDRRGETVFTGFSPAVVELSSRAGFFRKADYLVGLEKEGYGRVVVPVRFSLDGWYFGNLFVGGLIGFLIIDPATGAMYKLDTPLVDEQLTMLTVSADEPKLRVYSVDEVPESWRQHLVNLGE